MIVNRKLNIEDNIIFHIVEEHLFNGTVLIFPSNINLNIAAEYLQKQWSFETIKLMTMEDLNNLLCLSSRPCMQDAKRLLAFYQSLSAIIKEKYHLTDYFSSISFARQFFSLFEEIRAEGVHIDTVYTKLESQEYFSDWQTELWHDLLDIRSSYADYLELISFDDIIFTDLNFEIVEDYLSTYSNVVFCNQYYFTGSEEQLIERLSLSKTIYIYEQTLEEKKSSSAVYLYSSPNMVQMVNQMTLLLSAHDIRAIVDYDYLKSSWYPYLCKERFIKPLVLPFTHSSIYQYFQLLSNLFNSLVYVETKRKYLFPLHEVYKSFTNPSFYLIDSCNELFIRLAQKGYLYFDPYEITYMLLETDSEVVKEIITSFSNLMKDLIIVRSMNELINKIMQFKQFSSGNELEEFYEKLSNLYTIEEFSIVVDWRSIFPSSSFKPLITDLLQFLLEYLGAGSLSVASHASGSIRFHTLLDTRNVIYDKIMIMNVNEGILPKSKSVDFLFNESQRKMIGLKTYEEIRDRERYYFMRLVKSSKECHILYIENETDNIERSSFVEELAGAIEGERMREEERINAFPTDLREEERINALHTEEFPSKIYLNTYSIFEFLSDPYEWYFNYHLGYRKLKYPCKDRYDNRILGIVIHTFIESLFRNGETLSDIKLKLTDSNFESNYRKLVYDTHINKTPHDFSGRYFENVLFPYVKSNIKQFFTSEPFISLCQRSAINIEHAISDTLFFRTDKYEVYLSGRIDMLVTDITKNQRFIIDFKTGREDKHQLYLYEWLLQQNEVIQYEYNMRFFSIFSASNPIRIIGKSDVIENLRSKLQDVLCQIV